MIEFDEAQSQLIEAAVQARCNAGNTAPESIAVKAALGRVLAQPVAALRDMPPADNSAMDGYAVRAADYVANQPLPVQQRCYAGDVPQTLQPGHATRIFTGSLIPPGADTVVMQENCTETDAGVVMNGRPEAGQHIRRQGEDTRVGTVLVGAGTRLNAAHVSMIAAQGLSHVQVWPQLRIGILTTGDELIQPGAAASVEKIFDSNGSMLRALVQQMQAQALAVEHAVDDLDALRDALTRLAATSDMVLTVGGVSVGERDLVKPALESLGGQLDLWKVRMKPGKPVALGHVHGVPVVCLPGNPVSAYAVFALLVSPMIRARQGRADVLPITHTAVLRSARTYLGDREDFIRVQAQVSSDGLLQVSPYTAQASGIMSSLPWATGLARVVAGVSHGDGSLLRYYPFASWLQ